MQHYRIRLPPRVDGGEAAEAASRTRDARNDTPIRLCVRGVAPRRSFPLADPLPSTDSAGLRPLFARFPGVGSEEARSVALTLASVRRSNGACRFPALRFHEDAYAGMRRKQSARPGRGPGDAVGSSNPDATSGRLVGLNDP